MHAFTDSRGRKWHVVIDVAAIKRVRQVLGVNLYALVEDGARPLGALLGDLPQLVDVLFLLCQHQAAKEEVSDEDFGASFSGDVIEEAAEAFTQALADFFPSRARTGLKRVLSKSKAVLAKVHERGEKALDELDQMDTDQLAGLVLDRLTTSSGKPPASSASTPALSPSASS